VKETPRTVTPEIYATLQSLTRADLTIFAGPSLVHSPIGAAGSHLCVPPIRDGDLSALLASATPPAIVLMIDGYFGAGQAVTLTEVRTVIESGVRLYGCASMGALRAVEAHPWGMVGLGRIYASYLTGERTEDENVALTHDEDYNALTAPMVNVDELCTLLTTLGTPSAELDQFRRGVRSLYYADRSFSGIRSVARQVLDNGLDAALYYLEPERHWIWDAKRHDAENAIVEIVTGSPVPTVPVMLTPVPARVGALLDSW
jgi:hypothetical protein